MNKKQKIHAGVMQQTRVFVGRDGVTARVKRQFSIAFSGTPTRPGASDLIRVKVQDSCRFDVQSIIDDLEATGAGIFIGARGKFLIFEKIEA